MFFFIQHSCNSTLKGSKSLIKLYLKLNIIFFKQLRTRSISLMNQILNLKASFFRRIVATLGVFIATGGVTSCLLYTVLTPKVKWDYLNRKGLLIIFLNRCCNSTTAKPLKSVFLSSFAIPTHFLPGCLYSRVVFQFKVKIFTF